VKSLECECVKIKFLQHWFNGELEECCTMSEEYDLRTKQLARNPRVNELIQKECKNIARSTLGLCISFS